jgi:hypothetical protein
MGTFRESLLSLRDTVLSQRCLTREVIKERAPFEKSKLRQHRRFSVSEQLAFFHAVVCFPDVKALQEVEPVPLTVVGAGTMSGTACLRLGRPP